MHAFCMNTSLERPSSNYTRTAVFQLGGLARPSSLSESYTLTYFGRERATTITCCYACYVTLRTHTLVCRPDRGEVLSSGFASVRQRRQISIPEEESLVAPSLRRARGLLSKRALTAKAVGVPAWESFTANIESGAVNILLGAVAFQWFGMGALMLAAPLYREQMSEEAKWPEIFDTLTESGGVEPVEPSKVKAALQRGAVLLDVRTKDQASNNPLPSATNIPIYRPMSKNDFFSWAKRIVFAWNGKAGTEYDPEWPDKVVTAVPKGKKVVLVCNQGGNLEVKIGLPQGTPSRSLKAAYYLKNAGYKKVAYLKGGAYQYLKEVQREK